MVDILNPDEMNPGTEELQKPGAQPPRMQSPSSILTYRQCPRKYFYRYIARLPSKPSIHLIRGSVAHKVMEKIFDVDVSRLPDEQFMVTLKVILHEMFQREWDAASFSGLDLNESELQGYYEETKVMINNFFHYLVDRMQATGLSDKEAFESITPDREVELRSTKDYVRGFADAVHKDDGKTVILDYKTSSKCEITEDYNLQLSIYGMIYEETRQLPDEVGILFLKHGREIRLPMTSEMADFARNEVHVIHSKTKSKDINDYPLKPGPLCKWSTGQCDYYELCFGKKTLLDFG